MIGFEEELMKNVGAFLSGFFLIFVLTGVSNALTVELETTGIWTGTVNGDYVEGINTGKINWGGKQGPVNELGYPTIIKATPQSGLEFAGVNKKTVDTDTVFSLGTLSHENFTILTTSAVKSATLEIALNIYSPDPQMANLTFNFTVDETDNNPPPGQRGPEDYIEFPTSFASEKFSLENNDYTLQLLGFGLTAQNLVPYFESPENGTNSTTLWGQITAAPVPQPASLILFTSGLLGLAFVGRRKNG